MALCVLTVFILATALAAVIGEVYLASLVREGRPVTRFQVTALRVDEVALVLLVLVKIAMHVGRGSRTRR